MAIGEDGVDIPYPTRGKLDAIIEEGGLASHYPNSGEYMTPGRFEKLETIERLVLKDDDELDLGTFTVLVGANNVGKSQTLSDIHRMMTGGPQVETILVDDIEFTRPDEFDELLHGLGVRRDPRNTDRHLVSGLASNLKSGTQQQLHLDQFQQRFEQGGEVSPFLRGNLGRFKVAYLDAGSRLEVASECQSHDAHKDTPESLLQALYEDRDVHQELRDAFQATFGMDIHLDYYGLKTLRLRVADEFPELPENPIDGREIIDEFQELDDQGDGFRSFVGVVLSLLLSEGRVILLDEPEAFLHPAQARQLGEWIAEHAQGVPGQIVVATHNSNFVSGVLQTGAEVDIVRLNREGDTTVFHTIPADVTTELSQDPVLSSQRVIEAIFHRGVVICEGDSDRSVYRQVASRELGTTEFLFVHAHNKHTIKRVAAPLRESRIPCCGVVDIDILNSGPELRQLLDALSDSADVDDFLPPREEVATAVDGRSDEEILSDTTEEVRTVLSELEGGEHTVSGAKGAVGRVRKKLSRWRDVKDNGVEGLPDEVRETGKSLIEDLKGEGVFVVHVGELEGWMELGTSRKRVWVTRALEAIDSGNCPDPLRDFVDETTNYLLARHRELVAPTDPA